MMIRYAILERTPFPGEWMQAAIHRIQEAEYEIFHKVYGDAHYHQRAMRRYALHPVLLYKWDDAQLLIAYLQKSCPYAEYKVLGFVTNK